jgi:septum formation protein
MKKIILASGSPRRKMLLEWAEIPFEIYVSDADESFQEGGNPSEIACQIALAKNRVVFNILEKSTSDFVILSADTIVVFNKKIIGKPKDRAEAIAILQLLSGQTHQVITAVCISDKSNQELFSESTMVSFHKLTLSQIEHYVDTYKPFDKAGAYAIQEWIGVVGIKNIEGDFYNVMGLPISKVVQKLEKYLDRPDLE